MGTMRGYVRVSTTDQAKNGVGLDAQVRAIEGYARAENVEEVVWYVDDGKSGKDQNRPALQRLLGDVRPDDRVVGAKLDRLTRSVIDAGDLLDRARREGWALVALDVGADTSTATGEMLWNIIAVIAQWERRRISERTCEGMQTLKEQGWRLGRKSSIPDEIIERVVAEREAGLSLKTIADRLNDEDVPAAAGGRWHPATVHRVLKTAELDAEAPRGRRVAKENVA